MSAWSSPGERYPSPWLRIAARFLDGLIVGLVMSILVAPLVLADGDSAGFAGIGGDLGFGKRLVIGVFSIVVGFVYEAVTTNAAGGTPMKLAFGMRVVSADGGGRIDMEQSVLRWAIPGAFGILPVLGGWISFVLFVVSLVLLFVDPRHRTISDRVARTVVVSAR